MAFSCKIMLAQYAKADGMQQVYLQAIIDRRRAAVPMGFYIKKESFDFRNGSVKASHPNSDTYNSEMLRAVAMGNQVASKFRLENKKLTPQLFIEEFTNPSSEVDLIKFIEQELKVKRATLAANTIKQHVTVIKKLQKFRKKIRFGDLNPDVMREFKGFLTGKEGNSQATANKLLKIVKQYCDTASKRGFKFSDPFQSIKIKNFKSNRVSLTQHELDAIEAYYQSPGCDSSHKKLLRYFLFSCYTGLRISDVKTITWNNISDNILTYMPAKTKSNNEQVKVPLLDRDLKLLPEYTPGIIFKTFTDPVSNRYLKNVAEKLNIHKNITYHTSRHTFGSLFAEGGNIVALQKMMGHSDIKTTMGYIHTSTQSLVDAKRERYSKDEKRIKLEKKHLKSQNEINKTDK